MKKFVTNQNLNAEIIEYKDGNHVLVRLETGFEKWTQYKVRKCVKDYKLTHRPLLHKKFPTQYGIDAEIIDIYSLPYIKIRYEDGSEEVLSSGEVSIVL